jgi:hypothetical protein
VKLPPQSPNLNAHAERFVRSIKETCLERLILFGEHSLRRATAEFVAHYHGERNHQGLGDRLIHTEPPIPHKSGRIHRRERLGGLLNSYYRAAARRTFSGLADYRFVFIRTGFRAQYEPKEVPVAAETLPKGGAQGRKSA